MKSIHWRLLAIAAISSQVFAAELPIELYGRMPTVDAMTVSPNGSKVAFRRTDHTMDAVFVVNPASGDIIGVLDASTTKVRSLGFLDEDRLVLFAEESAHIREIGHRIQVSASFLFDLRSNTLSRLLEGSRHLYPIQSGTGTIVGHNPASDTVYMPAFIGKLNSTPPTFGLLAVSLDDPDGRLLTRGTSDTRDWFVNQKGEVIAEEEYDHRKDVQRIWARDGDKRRLVYEAGAGKPGIGVIGMSQDLGSLIISRSEQGSEFHSYHELTLKDGSIGPPIFHREDANVIRSLVDVDRCVYGVEYSGFFPRYEFFDPALTERVKAIQAGIPGTAVYLQSWTPDFSYMLFRLTGGWTSGAFVIVGPDSNKAKLLANMRDEIPREAVVPTTVISYTAADGLKIPALVTVSEAVKIAGKAPLIVLPHGGPEAYDRFSFDWIAQYFASRGMVVLQPQFRGSVGFGRSLQRAGKGQWGQAMSTDLDDGVTRLIEDGLVDPERVCMVGLSYGGYAALAAGAFSTFDYKCLVSIAGVSDLPYMLDGERELYGRDSEIVNYWQAQFGSEGKSDRMLEPISPVNFAENFRAPVLLVHGADDAIVPLAQSLRMEKALKRADKPVELVRLKGEDHYLSGYETRREALQAVAVFVEKHL